MPQEFVSDRGIVSIISPALVGLCQKSFLLKNCSWESDIISCLFYFHNEFLKEDLGRKNNVLKNNYILCNFKVRKPEKLRKIKKKWLPM